MALAFSGDKGRGALGLAIRGGGGVTCSSGGTMEGGGGVSCISSGMLRDGDDRRRGGSRRAVWACRDSEESAA